MTMNDPSAKKLSLGVLASGSGSNLQSILDAAASGKIPVEVKAVLCNRPKAKALAAHLPTDMPPQPNRRGMYCA